MNGFQDRVTRLHVKLLEIPMYQGLRAVGDFRSMAGMVRGLGRTRDDGDEVVATASLEAIETALREIATQRNATELTRRLSPHVATTMAI